MCDLQYVKELGKGGFAKTDLVTTPDGKGYAFKTFLSDDATILSLREIDVFMRAKTKTITHGIKFYAPDECKVGPNNDGAKGGITLDLKEGDLYGIMKIIIGGDISIPDEEVRAIYQVMLLKDLMADTLEALRCLHAMGYLHCDIKPSNILYKKVGYYRGGLPKYQFYLSDFGACIPILKETEKKIPFTQTPSYLPPEAFKKGKLDVPYFSVKSDIYALGLTFLSVLGINIDYSPALDAFYQNKNLDNYYDRKVELESWFTEKDINDYMAQWSQNFYAVTAKYPNAMKWRTVLNDLFGVMLSMLALDEQKRLFSYNYLNIIARIPNVYPEFGYIDNDCQEEGQEIKLPVLNDSVTDRIIVALRKKLFGLFGFFVQEVTLGVCLFLRYVSDPINHNTNFESVFDTCILTAKIFHRIGTKKKFEATPQQQREILNIILSPTIGGKIYIDPLVHGTNYDEVRDRIMDLTDPIKFDYVIEYMATYQFSSYTNPAIAYSPFRPK